MSAETCPRCLTTTVTLDRAAPWCPRCEWNLDAFDQDRRAPELGWRWVDRRLHRLAFRLAHGQYADLVKADLAQRATLPRVVIGTVSVILLAVFLALVVGGVLLIARGFPSWWLVPGAVLLAVAWILRPRLGRLTDLDGDEITRDDAPHLFALLDEVATAVGTTTPPTVLVDHEVNAYTTTVGFRRRRVLCLGLPLWAVLEPQERVALLGHEFGHFVNGDGRRSMLAQPALRMLGEAAMLIRPGYESPGGNVLVILAELAARGVLHVLSNLLLLGQVVLLWIGLRDGQRAEYQADGIAARVGGSTATSTLMEIMAAGDVVHMLIRRDARVGLGPADWRSSVAGSGLRGGPRTAARLQLSVRDDASLFATHPPAGLRSRMLRERTHLTPAVTLTPARAEKIDAELSALQEAFRREATYA
ncbi:M48 family metalloprotease [Asanoa sp. WMMD1127]|uniref:M48 family metalloprotease n=1 Tax=Asanoa sp. WMMD1127 TaxID=3016107 RepID=UPI00241671E4|nr:M48 family metallopeptidase [Asanoa sp. WMMD1127]MDG4825698.1 M48 family metalloprotease [Asanoa sp. WMMD1127]